MKNNVIFFSLAYIFVMLPFYPANAQDPLEIKSQQLDLKLQLLDSKLELLDSKIKLWESKPEELEIRLDDISQRMNTFDFDPSLLNSRVEEIDRAIRQLKEDYQPNKIALPGQNVITSQEDYYVAYRSAIMMNPVRLFEGIFQLSYERLITDRFSVSVAGMATYATEKGMTNYFFANQAFSYYDAISSTYIYYKGESIAGGGVIVQ